MIRVLVVSSSAVVRAGLESLVRSSPELQITGAFADFAGLEGVQADVILTSGPVEHPQAASPAPVVLLTGDTEPVWTIETIRLSVRAMLPRDATGSQILAAVYAAASGLAVIDPADLERVAAGNGSTSDQPQLTKRELEVLRMMADGAANKTIAWQLGISEHTVKFHVASILTRLGAGSRTEAVTIGIRRGLILL